MVLHLYASTVLYACIQLVFFIVIVRLLVIDIINRVKISREETEINENDGKICNNCNCCISSATNIYQRMLNILALLTLILCTVITFIFILFYVPILCIYVNFLNIPILGMPKLFLTFYQINRIHYCFHHSVLTKYLCIFLYLNGAIILLIRLFCQKYIGSVRIIDTQYCIYEQKGIFWRILTLYFIAYYAFVLSLLLIKINKLTNINISSASDVSHVTQNKINQQHATRRHNNIRRFLYKTLIVTVSIDSITFLLYIGRSVISRLLSPSPISSFFTCLIVTLTSCEMILFCEHNNLYYIKFGKYLIKSKLFFCCKSFINKSIPKQLQVSVPINGDYSPVLFNHDSENKQIGLSRINTSSIDINTKTSVQRSLAVNIPHSTT